MHRLSVLIHQARPYYQMLLHQAFNAQGVYNVRLADPQWAWADCMARGQQPVDVLVLDQSMPGGYALSLFHALMQASCVGGLLFVGRKVVGEIDLALEARKSGLNVLAELSLPMSMVGLEKALERLWVPANTPSACG